MLEIEGEKLNQAGKDELGRLYVYHSMMYRDQRKYYHDVREKAHNEPKVNPKVQQSIVSILYLPHVHTLYLLQMISQITDGAAQVHTSIPHYGKSGGWKTTPYSHSLTVM